MPGRCANPRHNGRRANESSSGRVRRAASSAPMVQGTRESGRAGWPRPPSRRAQARAKKPARRSAGTDLSPKEKAVERICAAAPSLSGKSGGKPRLYAAEILEPAERPERGKCGWARAPALDDAPDRGSVDRFDPLDDFGRIERCAVDQ